MMTFSPWRLMMLLAFWTSDTLAQALSEEDLHKNVLPWVFQRNPKLQEQLALLDEQHLALCAQRIALALEQQPPFRYLSAAEKNVTRELHKKRLLALLEKEKAFLVQAHQDEPESPCLDEDTISEDTRKERNQKILAMMQDETVQANTIREHLHAALEKEIHHRIKVIKVCPVLKDFPDQRFLYLWQLFKEKPHLSKKDLQHFFNLLRVIEIMNKKAEENPHYRVFLDKKKNLLMLVNNIRKERRQLAAYCQKYQHDHKLHEALLTFGALDLIALQAMYCQHPEQREVLKGYFQKVKSLPRWSEHLVDTFFMPIPSDFSEEKLMMMYAVLQDLRQKLYRLHDPHVRQSIVQDFIYQYPKKLKKVKALLITF